MRPYEVMVILDSAIDESGVQATIDKAKEVITSRLGAVGQVEKWGRRRFAYEMNHRWEGYYLLAGFNAEPDAVAELDRTLLLSDDVLRHKIIRIPESVADRKKSATVVEQAERAPTESTGAE